MELKREITVELLASCKCRARRLREESKEDYVKRLTHIGLTKRGITDMDGIKHAVGAAAVYLHDNQISRIQGVMSLRYLSQLFLQKNNISKMEGLDTLPSLEKLHLGRNRITVLEGLTGLLSLKELNIEDQRLPVGEKLVVDPRSTLAVAKSLEILNISGNSLEELDELTMLRKLRKLNLANNNVNDMQELQTLLRANTGLKELRIAGNPLTNASKHREMIIIASIQLSLLDAKEVTPMQRQFLINWKTSRASNNPNNRNRHVNKSFAGVKAPVAKFPSRLSSQNPHWIAPLPPLKK